MQDEPAETTTTIRVDDSITYDRFSSLLETKIDSIMGRIVEFKDEIKKEMLMLANRLSAVESENQQLRTELQQLKQQPPISPVVNELYSTINDLKTELNERDQSSLLNDVEITGLPEFEKESTGHLVMAIGAKLGMVLEERDVVSAARVGARRPPPGEGAPGVPPAAAGRAPGTPRPTGPAGGERLRSSWSHYCGHGAAFSYPQTLPRQREAY
ncbi:unnamed protein product [Plutella xylostella]|uniref:(diamondback moth) hypothetical protein n=1 Tax=Plutella xylostella TaxID=51655 RepID=A0A8S4GDM6_PLUXY|nr:unnamed protein product [Plutella xylostella]